MNKLKDNWWIIFLIGILIFSFLTNNKKNTVLIDNNNLNNKLDSLRDITAEYKKTAETFKFKSDNNYKQYKKIQNEIKELRNRSINDTSIVSDQKRSNFMSEYFTRNSIPVTDSR